MGYFTCTYSRVTVCAFFSLISSVIDKIKDVALIKSEQQQKESIFKITTNVKETRIAIGFEGA